MQGCANATASYISYLYNLFLRFISFYGFPDPFFMSKWPSCPCTSRATSDFHDVFPETFGDFRHGSLVPRNKPQHPDILIPKRGGKTKISEIAQIRDSPSQTGGAGTHIFNPLGVFPSVDVFHPTLSTEVPEFSRMYGEHHGCSKLWPGLAVLYMMIINEENQTWKAGLFLVSVFRSYWILLYLSNLTTYALYSLWLHV